jgi:TRAP-type C4-dicarboxylate transport system permease small subunit
MTRSFVRPFARRFEAAIDAIVAVAVAGAVTLAAVQVSARYLLNESLPWIQETTRFLFLWLVMLGSAAACARGSHIAFDMLIEHAPPAAARALRFVVLAAMLAFLAVIAVSGTELVVRNIGQRTAVLGLPIAAVYASVPFGAALGFIGCLIAATRSRS